MIPLKKMMSRHYSLISKLSLIIIAIAIVLNSFTLNKYDHWPADLFFYLSLFSLVLMLDFLFYMLYSKSGFAKSHSVFCSFPITRYKVLYLETVKYFSRFEFLLFYVSAILFTVRFYLRDNSSFSFVILIITAYSLQIIFLVLFLFAGKNIMSNDSTDSLRSFVLSIIFGTSLITIFSEKLSVINYVFIISPFSNGFLSFLIGPDKFVITCILTILLILISVFIIKRKFITWLH